MFKKLTLILAGLLLAASNCFAQPTPMQYDLTLTTTDTVTSWQRIPAGLVPVAVWTFDITNATSFNIQVSFDAATTPTNHITILEIDAATDYTVSIADSSVAVFNANNIMPVLGQAGSDSDDYVWIRLSGFTAEGADKIFTLLCRWL